MAVEAPASAAPVERRRFRVPTAVVVPVALALLTAWIVPGFTRQFQDRQKARELKAAIVAKIGASSSQAILTSAFIAARRLPAAEGGGGRGFNQDAFNELDLTWRRSASELEAQLRAYFPRDVVVSWHTYAELVQNTYFLLTDRVYLRKETLERLRATLDPPERKHLAALAGPWSDTGAERTAYFFVSQNLLRRKDTVIQAVLDEQPGGFSTTRGDLLRDLLMLG